MMEQKYNLFTFGWLCILILLSTPVMAANVVFSITVNYDDGKLSLANIELIQGTAPDKRNEPDSGYTLNVVSFDKKILYSYNFKIDIAPKYDAPAEWFDKNGTQIYFPNTTDIVFTKTSILLTIPYFNNAKTIEIYDPAGKLALSIDVSEHATCNQNNICDPVETYLLCPQDCKAPTKLGSQNYLLPIIAAMSIVIGALFLFRKKIINLRKF